jgi:hypothetical protein
MECAQPSYAVPFQVLPSSPLPTPNKKKQHGLPLRTPLSTSLPSCKHAASRASLHAAVAAVGSCPTNAVVIRFIAGDEVTVRCPHTRWPAATATQDRSPTNALSRAMKQVTVPTRKLARGRDSTRSQPHQRFLAGDEASDGAHALACTQLWQRIVASCC